MWFEHLEDPRPYLNMYKEIPPLVDVRILSITFGEGRHGITITFNTPTYPDFPLDKWEGCDIASMTIDFYGIRDLQISTTGHKYRGDITIEKNAEGLLEVEIKGSLNLRLVAEFGVISNMGAYVYAPDLI